jgi:Concanavalin A-like lectin/glucanases superfamily
MIKTFDNYWKSKIESIILELETIALNGTIDQNPNIIGITLDTSSVQDDNEIGYKITDINGIGGTAPIVFSISSDIDDKFQIGGVNLDELQLKNTVDWTVKTSHSVSIDALDTFEKTFSEDFTITVLLQPHTNSNGLRLNNIVSNEYLSRTITGESIAFQTGDWSICYWINSAVQTSFSHFGWNDGTTTPTISCRNNGALTDDLRYSIRDNSGNLKDFGILTPSIAWQTGWHLLTLTYSLNNPNIYIDGVLQSKTYFTNQTLTSTLRTTTTMLWASRHSPPASTTNGFYDEITLWGVSLSGSNVVELYNSGSRDYNPNSHSQGVDLLAWYDCEELSGSLILDRTNNNFNLTGFNIDSSNIQDST